LFNRLDEINESKFDANNEMNTNFMPFLPALPSNILCIEEDSYYIKLLKYVLTQRGTRWNPIVNFINNHDDALRFIDEGYYKNFELPDLILIDIDMSNDRGFELMKNLKENPRLQDVSIITLSSFDSGIVLARSILSGADGFITKPADYKRLVPLIQSVWCGIPRVISTFSNN
jgi:CheY-like chemotaxis protein